MHIDGYIDALRELREAADRLVDMPGEARSLLSKFLVIDEAMLTLMEVELEASRNVLHALSPSRADRMRAAIQSLAESRSIKGALARRLAQPPGTGDLLPAV
ncbi:MAG TPA: hypothetical protein VKZ48_01535 [Burkholderiales bacterium]|nr:hypothetical protein [Burkholderiales bacterium]